MKEVGFVHYQTAHCESGVTSNLFRNAGVEMSEAMAFGIGSGIFFFYFPYLKVMGLPLTSYRSFPGTIFKKLCKRLGIPYEYKFFPDAIKGSRVMDDLLASGQAVGIRSSIYWLPYIPEKFRFQFNAHNLIVFAKRDAETYMVSDPVVETAEPCPVRALNKARFAKGVLAPKGLIFYPRKEALQKQLPWESAIRQGIRETTQRMLYAPMPWAGVKGIRYLSKQMRKWPKRFAGKLDTHKLWMANVVRMQEEIGTGGAGFRFLYAAFLEEAGERLNAPVLIEASKRMTEIGNRWRDFATLAAKFCKDRLNEPYEEIPNLLAKIAEDEKALFKFLRKEFL